MNAATLIQTLHGLGATLQAEDDKLRVTCPYGTLSQELREAIHQHKAEIIILLSESESSKTEPKDETLPRDRRQKINSGGRRYRTASTCPECGSDNIVTDARGQYCVDCRRRTGIVQSLSQVFPTSQHGSDLLSSSDDTTGMKAIP